MEIIKNKFVLAGIILCAIASLLLISKTNCQSRIISHFEPGKIEVTIRDDYKRTFKDCLLTSYSSQEWNRNKHDFTIEKKEFETIERYFKFPFYINVVILSKGIDSKLNVTPYTISYLEHMKEKKYIREFHILPSKEAVELYNKLAKEGEHVAILLCSTY